MKITLDLTSVVVGGAVALALGVVAGFSPQATSVPAARPADPTTMMSARPEPRDFVWLEARTAGPGGNSVDSPTLVVPQGKILVVTALSGSNPTRRVRMAINGVERETLLLYSSNSGIVANSALQFANGLPLAAGTTVQLIADPPQGNNSWAGWTWLHGYWADA